MASNSAITDLFARLLLDDSGFEVAVVNSAQKAGDKAGAEMSTRIGTALKRGAPVALAAMAAMFAGAAAGLADLDNQVKRFQATVGATDAEAKSASASALALYRTHRAGMDEILAAMAKLRTDQGLTQQGAEALTGAYLDWANVAGGTAEQAVSGMDDALDAYNLTAADGVAIMDELVASNQKYGGSLQQRLTDLSALAPAMNGLNLDVHDAIALENLFAAAGLDAGSAQRALNTAVKNLKPGETFDDLIRRISAVEDPTKRAQLAMEVFGARGGTQLAQALRPGITTLDEFAVSADDAAGRTAAASATIDASLPRQFEQFMHNLGGQIMELIGAGGPILLFAKALADLTLAFNTAKIAAVLYWAASAGPGALLAGAAIIASLALVEAQLTGVAASTEHASLAAFDYAGKQRAIAAAQADGTITAEEAERQYAALDDQYRDLIASLKAAQDGTTAATGAQREGTGAAKEGADAQGELSDATLTTADSLRTEIGAVDGVKDSTFLAADGIATFNTVHGGIPDQADKNVGALSAEAAMLDHVAFAASVAARNLSALGTAQAAADAANARRLRQLGEDPGAGISGSLQHGYVTAPVQTILAVPPGGGGGGGGGGGRGGASAAAEAARKANDTIKQTTKDAYAAAQTAADRYFDEVHSRRLAEIEDARRAAHTEVDVQRRALNEILDAKRAAIMAPVDAEEQALRDRQNARRREQLVAAQTAAQASGDAQAIADATAALQDFDDELALATHRAAALADAAKIDNSTPVSEADLAAQVASDLATAMAAANPGDGMVSLAKLDAIEAAIDPNAQAQVDAENRRDEKVRASFKASLKLSEDRLLKIQDKSTDIRASGIQTRDAIRALLEANGISVPKSDTAERHAQGGVVGPKPTLSWVGEGVREAIVPLKGGWSDWVRRLAAIAGGEPGGAASFPGLPAFSGPLAAAGAAGFAMRGGHTINVYNPRPEPASMSAADGLKRLSSFGEYPNVGR